MANIETVIVSNRQAVGAFVEATRAVSPEKWATPRAPGKWSPGQVAEHVTLTYEQSRRMLDGAFTGPAKPWFQQLLARRLFLPQLLKRGYFSDRPLVGPDFIDPGKSPASATDLRDRLEAAAGSLERELVTAADSRRVTVDHPIFGRLPLADLLGFLAIHTKHHRPQLSADV